MKKVAFVGKECVACGNCTNVCTLNAIEIYKGKYAKVDKDKCVGCGRCYKACPASVISIEKREIYEK